MHWTPNTPYTLIQTGHHPSALHPPQFFPTRIPQQIRLFQHLMHLQVPHTNSLLPAINIGAANNGMSVWARRDVYLDLWMLGRKRA